MAIVTIKPIFSKEARYWVRTASLTGVMGLLEQHQVDPAKFRADNQLAENFESFPDRRISYRKFLGILNYCATETKRSDFGALLSTKQDIEILGALGLAMIEAPTLRIALDNLINYYNVHLNGARVRLKEQNGLALLSFQLTISSPPNYRQQIDLVLGIGIRFIRRYFGQVWAPQNIYVSYSKGRDMQSTLLIYQSSINYDKELNAFSFPAEMLDRSRNKANAALHRILVDYLNIQSKNLPSDLRVMVNERIITSLQNGVCSIDNIAGGLGMTRRTFQRRLDSQGLKYKDVLEQTRMDLAQRYLRMSAIPVTQIAVILCYADLSSFSHSFQRYNGESPKQWRSSHREYPSC